MRDRGQFEDVRGRAAEGKIDEFDDSIRGGNSNVGAVGEHARSSLSETEDDTRFSGFGGVAPNRKFIDPRVPRRCVLLKAVCTAYKRSRRSTSLARRGMVALKWLDGVSESVGDQRAAVERNSPPGRYTAATSAHVFSGLRLVASIYQPRRKQRHDLLPLRPA